MQTGKESKQKKYKLSLEAKGLAQITVVIPEKSINEIRRKCDQLRYKHLEQKV